MPTRVTDDPLRLSCVFSDGSRAEFDLTGSPNPWLVRDLAIGLVELIHPHGSAAPPARSTTTCVGCTRWCEHLPIRVSPAVSPICGVGNWRSSGWRARTGWRR
jgi:hypothetical protein